MIDDTGNHTKSKGREGIGESKTSQESGGLFRIFNVKDHLDEWLLEKEKRARYLEEHFIYFNFFTLVNCIECEMGGFIGG